MSFQILTPYYEGPMDLLLDLVSKKKIEIYDISISELTNNYLEVLETTKDFNMEVTSDFIYMATRLLEIKSRYLLFLSVEEEMEDPRKELFESLKEYAVFKEISRQLADLEESIWGRIYRPTTEIYVEEAFELKNMENISLIDYFPTRLKEKNAASSRSFLKTIISVEEKIAYIQEILSQRTRVFFDEVVEKKDNDETIASILGVLELAKNKNLNLEQKTFLDRIMLEKLH